MLIVPVDSLLARIVSRLPPWLPIAIRAVRVQHRVDTHVIVRFGGTA